MPDGGFETGAGGRLVDGLVGAVLLASASDGVPDQKRQQEDPAGRDDQEKPKQGTDEESHAFYMSTQRAKRNPRWNEKSTFRRSRSACHSGRWKHTRIAPLAHGESLKRR